MFSTKIFEPTNSINFDQRRDFKTNFVIFLGIVFLFLGVNRKNNEKILCGKQNPKKNADSAVDYKIFPENLL